jgi:rRNA-processing protein FCF1
MKIILDTNILIRFPKILSIKLADYEFIIPTCVLDEIGTWIINRDSNVQLHKSLLDLIVNSNKEGFVTITDTPINTKLDKDLQYNPRLSETDRKLVTYASLLKESGSEVGIASQDREIKSAVQTIGINYFSLQDLVNLVSQRKPDKELNEKVNKYEKVETNIIKLALIIALVFIIIGFIFGYFFNNILSTVSIWGIVLLIMIAGIMLYIFKRKLRLGYGLTEFLAGTITSYLVIKSSTPQSDYMEISYILKVLAGLYIIVRGLDNMTEGSKGLKLGFWIQDKLKIK